MNWNVIFFCIGNMETYSYLNQLMSIKNYQIKVRRFNNLITIKKKWFFVIWFHWLSFLKFDYNNLIIMNFVVSMSIDNFSAFLENLLIIINNWKYNFCFAFLWIPVSQIANVLLVYVYLVYSEFMKILLLFKIKFISWNCFSDYSVAIYWLTFIK